MNVAFVCINIYIYISCISINQQWMGWDAHACMDDGTNSQPDDAKHRQFPVSSFHQHRDLWGGETSDVCALEYCAGRYH
jgi:hypothetical protein